MEENAFVSSLSLRLLRQWVRIPLVSSTYAAMIYLEPLLDGLGKRPIWSVAILPVIWRGRKRTSLFRTLVVVISVGSGSVRSDGGSIGLVFVDRMFIFVFRMWPLAVGMDFGRCLRTRSEVRPGQVA